MVSDLLDNGIIRESDSPYASPILLVKKKNGEQRMCVDYRALNAKTIKDRFPLPHVDDFLDKLKGCRYFTSLDLASGYHQIQLEESSIPKTAFITPDGHFEYLRVPFGLCNAPAVFQRTINKVLGNLRYGKALAYMDDILLPSADFHSGLANLRLVFQSLRDAGLTLRLSKCQYFMEKVEYLGHEISSEGVQPGRRKTECVDRFPEPTDVRSVRQFLGLAGYFRKYIKDFAIIARPLTNLTKKDVSFAWGEDQHTAFQSLKTKLTSRPLLAIYDPELKTEVHTDASKVGIGGILLQAPPNGMFRPVMYYSRQTTKEEQRYHSYELETMAMVYTLKAFRIYLMGIQFKVVTDCNAIRTTLTKRDLVPRIGRWWLAIQEYKFDVEYRAGHKMSHADALSRNPRT
ncbi:RNase H-like domain found in reverse transcriptase [Popillia japonica]|uniref:RNA-directed DNA polymerase n=1 Tax=Popillia japonica TaxID=7064 RepID=A0AAW1ITP6_POPJA